MNSLFLFGSFHLDNHTAGHEQNKEPLHIGSPIIPARQAFDVYPNNLTFWFLTASSAIDFKPVSIAQLIQVELLRRQQAWLKIEAPPCQIPKNSSCLGIPRSRPLLFSVFSASSRLCVFALISPIVLIRTPTVSYRKTFKNLTGLEPRSV